MLLIGNEKRGLTRAIKREDTIGIEIPNLSAMINYVDTRKVSYYENREVLAANSMKREIWAVPTGGVPIYLCVVDNVKIAEKVVSGIWKRNQSFFNRNKTVYMKEIIDEAIKE